MESRLINVPFTFLSNSNGVYLGPKANFEVNSLLEPYLDCFFSDVENLARNKRVDIDRALDSKERAAFNRDNNLLIAYLLWMLCSTAATPEPTCDEVMKTPEFEKRMRSLERLWVAEMRLRADSLFCRVSKPRVVQAIIGRPIFEDAEYNFPTEVLPDYKPVGRIALLSKEDDLYDGRYLVVSLPLHDNLKTPDTLPFTVRITDGEAASQLTQILNGPKGTVVGPPVEFVVGTPEFEQKILMFFDYVAELGRYFALDLSLPMTPHECSVFSRKSNVVVARLQWMLCSHPTRPALNEVLASSEFAQRNVLLERAWIAESRLPLNKCDVFHTVPKAALLEAICGKPILASAAQMFPSSIFEEEIEATPLSSCGEQHGVERNTVISHPMASVDRVNSLASASSSNYDTDSAGNSTVLHSSSGSEPGDVATSYTRLCASVRNLPLALAKEDDFIDRHVPGLKVDENDFVGSRGTDVLPSSQSRRVACRATFLWISEKLKFVKSARVATASHIANNRRSHIEFHAVTEIFSFDPNHLPLIGWSKGTMNDGTRRKRSPDYWLDALTKGWK